MWLGGIKLSAIRSFPAAPLAFLTLGAPFAGWHVLAGRKGAGKTTLLKAAALAVAGPIWATKFVEAPEDWVAGNETYGLASLAMFPAPEDRPAAGLEVIMPTVSWVAKASAMIPATVYGLYFVGMSFEEWSNDAFAVIEEVPPLVGTDLGDVGPWAANPDGWFLACYGASRRLLGGAATWLDPDQRQHRMEQLESLFSDSATLVEGIETLKSLYVQSLEERPGAKELLEATLQLLREGLLPEGVEALRVDSEGLRVRQGRNELALQQLSDGYRVPAALVLDLVMKLHEAFGPRLEVSHTDGVTRILNTGVVLIDEPEAQLDVSWQQRLGFWLKEHFPNLQFIVATHSPLICAAAELGKLYQVGLSGDEPRIGTVDEETWRRIVKGSPDAAAVSSLFGLESLPSQ